LLARSEDPEDALFGRVDEAKIGLAGHSLGGFQTTEESHAYTVAVAIQGAGTPRGDEAAPTLFMTSEGDEVIDDSIVREAFDRAIDDAWFANHATVDHEDPRIDGGAYREPVIAFLRWQLRQDATGGAWFEGDGCELCTNPMWSYDTR
jgi:predicted dienelactone hydrolase